MKPNSRDERGHTDLGVTLAIMIILGLVGWLAYKSEGKPLAMWLGWPWWGKALSIAVPLLLLFGGSAFESARRWPKP